MSAGSKSVMAICNAVLAVITQRSCSLAQGQLSNVRGLCSSSRCLAAKGNHSTAPHDGSKDRSASQPSSHTAGSSAVNSSSSVGAHGTALHKDIASSGQSSSTAGAGQPASTATSSSSSRPGPESPQMQQPGTAKATPAAAPTASTSGPTPEPAHAADAASASPASTMTAQAAAASKEGSVAGGAGTAPAVAAIIPKAFAKAASVEPKSAQVASAQAGSAQASPAAVASGSPLTAAAERLQVAGATLNRLTGYDMIAELKGRVAAADERLQELKRRLQASKANYEARISEQTQLQKELNALLQRKSSWGQDDVQRFTQLYANEHATEQAVAAAKAEYARLGEAVEDAQLAMMSTIRERYTQEQLWSDHIRQASTWWTWGLMGLHFASFVSVYAFLEPRKRAALREALAQDAQQQAEQTRAAFNQALAAVAAGGGAGGAAYAASGDVEGNRTGEGGARVDGDGDAVDSGRGSALWGSDVGSARSWEALAAAGLVGAGAGSGATAGGAGSREGVAGSEALAGLGQQLGCVLDEVRGLQKQLGQLAQQQQQQQQEGRLRRHVVTTIDTDAEQYSGDLLFDEGLTSTGYDQESASTAERPVPVASSDHVRAGGMRGGLAHAWRQLGDRLWPHLSVSGAQVALVATGSAVTGAAVAVLLSSRK